MLAKLLSSKTLPVRFNKQPARVGRLLLLLTAVWPWLHAPAAFAGGTPASTPTAKATPPRTASNAVKRLRLREAAANASFSFVPNAGQADPTKLFVARGPGFALGLERDGLQIDSLSPRPSTSRATSAASGGAASALHDKPSYDISTVRVQFLGASAAATVQGTEASAAKVNLIEGSDPSRWKTNLPAYTRVRYHELYPGIDLVYYGERERHLEYDLIVAAGADPRAIRLRVSSSQGASIDRKGNLLLDGCDGISLMHPVLYQDTSAGRQPIAGSFVELAKNEFGFAPAGYDRTRPLIIDPKIATVYATYAGGIHNDESMDMTLDASGNAYVTGWSASEDFPVTGNAFQRARKQLGSYLYDAVVLKFDPSGTLLFSTYLGGANNDQGEGIRVDANGLVYVAGFTQSNDFPVTSSAFQPAFGGSSDAFFAVLSNDGSQLIYSTYLGGSGDENVFRMIADPSGAFWLTGVASAAGLPVSTGAYQAAPRGGDTSFVAKVEYNGANAQPFKIDALTFLGGSASEESGSNDIALDAAGNLYVTGATTSNDFPSTANAYQKSSSFTFSGGCYNARYNNTAAFVTELSGDLKTLVYSSLLGGYTENQNGYPVCNQFGHTIHPDGKGNIWVVGTTGAADFPTTANAYSSTLNGNNTAGVDLFVTELTPGQQTTALTFSSYLGGSQFDYGSRAVWDANNNIWIVATTQSPDWPGIVSGVSLQQVNAGGYDISLTELQPDGTKILYATYFGGSGDEDAASGRATVALDPADNLHLAGGTGSGNFPVTPNAAQSVFANGDLNPDGYDIYYAVLGTGAIGTVGPVTGGNTGDTTISITGAGFVSGATCSLVSNGVAIATATASVNSSGTSATCTFPLTGAAPGTYDVVITNPSGGSTFTKTGGFTVTAGGEPKVWTTIIGRPKIRTGVASTVVVNYGNSGNTDAYLTNLVITAPSNLQLSYTLGAPPNLPSGQVVSTSVTTNGQTSIRLLLPRLRAGSSASFPITVVDNTDADHYTFAAKIAKPWFASAGAAASALTAASTSFTPAAACSASSATPNVANCLNTFLTSVKTAGATMAQVQSIAKTMLLTLQQVQATNTTPQIFGGNTFVPASQMVAGTLVVSGVPSYDNTLTYHVQTGSSSFLVPITSSNCVSYAANTNDSLGGTLERCTLPITVPTGSNITVAGGSLGLGPNSSVMAMLDGCFTITQPVMQAGFTLSPTENLQSCDLTGESGKDPDAMAPPGDDEIIQIGGFDGTVIVDPNFLIPDGGGDPEFPGDSGGSIDPNGKMGSAGDMSASAYVGGTAPLPYYVYFENQPTASLPAANVVVTDQLDPTKVDLSTVALGSITFGSIAIPVPGHLNSYSTTYKLSATLEVRIQGSLDRTTGLLKWTFTSLDPTTGQPPSDPTVGFLPPDTNGIVGQGSVSYNVMPLAGQATGTKIPNFATVIFDANAPILTPTFLNTLDVDPPVSKVTALPASVGSSGGIASIPVAWSGTDKGSGIKTYTIYASDNGGAFMPWQTTAGTTSGTYPGQINHSYGFYSIATDGAANTEAAKSAAEASTTVVGAVSTTLLTASPATAVPGQSVLLTATVAGPAGSATAPTGSVTFSLGSKSLGSGTLSAAGVATLAVTSLPVGSDSIQASYAGDATYSASNSNSVVVSVALIPTATLLATSAAAANPGASITFTATVAATSGSGTPSGTVTFLNGATSLGTGTLALGKATFTTTSLTTGSYSITAQYGGDSSFAGSTSTALAETIAAPSFSLAANPTTLTIARGQSGMASLTVTPAGSFSSAVSFACSGLPAYTTCTFAPATVTPNGSAAVSTTVTLATNVASAALHEPGLPSRGLPGVLAAFSFLGLLTLGRRYRLSGRGLLLMLCAIAALAGLAGCGGSSPSTTTPTGTTTVTVTATSGALSQSAPLTVTIQ